MARKIRNMSKEFEEYQLKILNHPNYKGLEYGGSWVKAGKSEVGQSRKAWADRKIRELSISGNGIYAQVMYEIHPWKEKPCQTCGRTMSLNYVYPHKNMQKILLSELPELNNTDISLLSIQDIESLVSVGNKGVFRQIILARLKNKASLEASTSELIDLLIEQSKQSRSNLGPGAMSNFPDRYDGFHSYNLCCRSKQDTGRHASNLKTYGKDRRAYENWSDGNHRAANQLMADSVFLGTGLSADHLGPVSLGFVHDPRFMVAISTSDNSSKRDRLLLNDLKLVISREKVTRLSAASWYCNIIWEKIREDILNTIVTSDEDLLPYYKILQKNKILFFSILHEILESEGGLEYLKHFLKNRFRRCHGNSHNYLLETDPSKDSFGQIIESTERNVTIQSQGELDRFIRVSLESVKDFNAKDNRRVVVNLDNAERIMIDNLKQLLVDGTDDFYIVKELENIMKHIQHRLLNE